jgi:hypothetical protein
MEPCEVDGAPISFSYLFIEFLRRDNPFSTSFLPPKLRSLN